MPIPSRPIPNPRHRQRPTRPGAAVPRKSLSATPQNTADWRAEMALLPEVGPKSVPMKLSGSMGREAKELSMSVEGKRDVGLERLIMDGRDKRGKRTTTATTLGFDFVTNPQVIALSEGEIPNAPDDLVPKPISLLTTTKSTLAHPDATSDALFNTPTTPALLATRSDSDGEDEDDHGDDDWEHISALSRPEQVEQRDENVCSDGEEDVIVLGEMEMEDDMAHLELGPKKKDGENDKKAIVTKEEKHKSYAAVALGV
ncbi:hypothetical protein C356_04820 [Cryptococcus neoformans c45]|nr:hypothetical protein C356_04820 [Cryptococcus neoformans var. grubii c45]